MTVRVRNAKRCVFLRQTKPYSPLHVFRVRSCVKGRARITFPPIKNHYQKVVRLKYVVRAVGAGHRKAQRKVTLHEAAGLPRPTASLTFSPQSLPYSGGNVTLTYSSTNATSCSLSTSPALGSGTSPLAVSCDGSTRLNGISSTTVQRQWTVTFTAKGPGGKTTTQRTLTQQALPPQPTAGLTITPQSLLSTGGQVTLAYSSSNATTCSLSTSPTLWSGSNPLTVPCNGTTTVNAPAAVAAQQWTITFRATSATGQAATAAGTLTQQAKPLVQSPNWSGYVLPLSSVVTDVSGTFTVPTLNCAQTPNAGEATWVGIGGYGSSTGDLLQTGVTSDCVNGVQADDPAWWEEYPELPGIDFSGMAVSPGDQIEATVYEASGSTTWVTCVDDLTTGISGVMVTGEGWGVTSGGCTGSFTLQGSTASLSYAGGTTAEWIVEDYATSVSPLVYAPFADYGTVTFMNLGTSLSPWYLVDANPLEIVQNSAVLSVPSAPSGDGFSVAYTG